MTFPTTIGDVADGEAAEALGLLDRLAAIEAWDRPLDPDDFAELRGSERFAAVAKTIASRAPAVTPSVVAMELDRVDLLPEPYVGSEAGRAPGRERV